MTTPKSSALQMEIKKNLATKYRAKLLRLEARRRRVVLLSAIETAGPAKRTRTQAGPVARKAPRRTTTTTPTLVTNCIFFGGSAASSVLP